MRYGRRKREVRGRYGITGHDPKKRFSSSLAGGYTMVEMVVAAAIFSLAATGAYRMAEGQMESFQNQWQKEQAWELCAAAYMEIQNQIQNAVQFQPAGRNQEILCFLDEKTGQWKHLRADDLSAADDGMIRIQLDFSDTTEEQLKGEIRAVRGFQTEEILAVRNLTVSVGGYYE